MKHHLVPIFVIVLVNFVSAGMVLPMLPLFAQRHFDSSPEHVAWMLASYNIALFLAAPMIGRLSDRFGRLPVLIVSQIGTVISFAMLAGASSMWQLYASRILDGVTGGNIIVAQAYITDISPKEERTRSLGVVWLALGLGQVLGPALGGYMSALSDDRLPYWIAAAVALLTVILTRSSLRETLTPERRAARRAATQQMGKLTLREAFTNRSLFLILIIAFVVQLILGLLTSTFSLYGAAVIFAGQSAAVQSVGIGTLLTMIGVGQMLTQLLWIKPLIDRFGERRLVLGGTALRAVAFLMLAFFVNPIIVGAALLVFAAASGAMMPSLQSLATTTVSEERNGAVLGMYQSSMSLSIIFGTVLGGSLFALLPNLPYLAGALILLVVALPAVLLLQRTAADVIPSTITPSYGISSQH